MTFDIGLLDESKVGGNGQRLGCITINDFTERFAAYHPDPDGDVGDLPGLWRAELSQLVDGAPAVRLVHDPRMAWVVYREGDDCFVQKKNSSMVSTIQSSPV
jgi:hypothetical protein